MRLTEINLEKARKEAAKLGSLAEREFALAVIDQLERLQAERQVLASTPVPAAFTGRKPDTPEAKAARRQIATTKGRNPGSVGGG